MTEPYDAVQHLEYLEELIVTTKDTLLEEKEAFFDNDYSKERLTKRLAAFFQERDMSIVELKTGQRSKDYYDVAKHIWKSKEVLIPFIKNIPACVNDKTREFDYNTKNLNKEDAGYLWNFCTYIQNKKKWFTFEKKDNNFHIKLSSSNQYVKFFNGGWAEEVSLYLIDKALKKFKTQGGSSNKLFWNVCLKKFGSDHHSLDMELDLVVQIKDRFYIFEVKTGVVLLIDKWVDRTRLFDSKNSKYITCTSNKKLEPRTFLPYVLFALPTLEKQFLELLSRDFPNTSN